MSLFKRIGEVLTPPPTRKPPPPPAPPGHGPDEQINEQLRKHVRSIILSETSDHPELVYATNEIMKTADRHDAYVIAARVQMQMESLSTRLAGLDSSRYGRIYALAGELIQRHVLKEIAAIETGRSTLGPNIFATYCSDLLGNLIEGKGLGPAIEITIQIADRLLFDAIDSFDKRSIYLSMAEVAMRRACEQVEHFSANRQMRPLWPESDGGGPTVGDATVFVCGLHNQVTRIRDACLSVELPPGLHKHELKTAGTGERAAVHVRYLQALLAAIRPAAYPPMKARIEIRAGMLIASGNPEHGRKILLSAAHHFEVQADKEAALQFGVLSRDRYGRAGSLYAYCRDTEGQQRISQKLGEDSIEPPGASHLDSQI